MSDESNPRAFPSTAIDDRFGAMKLWDFYSAHALGAIIQQADDSSIALIAEAAGAVADAMVAERAKRFSAEPTT